MQGPPAPWLDQTIRPSGGESDASTPPPGQGNLAAGSDVQAPRPRLAATARARVDLRSTGHYTTFPSGTRSSLGSSQLTQCQPVTTRQRARMVSQKMAKRSMKLAHLERSCDGSLRLPNPSNPVNRPRASHRTTLWADGIDVGPLRPAAVWRSGIDTARASRSGSGTALSKQRLCAIR